MWLPTAGPDISLYWQSEINYFRSIWGPAYRAKLNTRASFASAMSLAMGLATKQTIRLNDMRELGPALDWENDPHIRGSKTPNGLANVWPTSYVAGDRDRFTMFGVVTDFAKRNNMMFALIGREMGIDKITLRNAPNVKDEVNKLLGNPNDIGTPDSPAAFESYEAGFDLYDDVSLQTVISSRGLKMQEPQSRSQKEWPSYESTTKGLRRRAAGPLQALIQ